MIEKINTEWEIDSQIDRNKITEESLRTPNLHQKYVTMLMSVKNKMVKLDKEMRILKFDKYKYYKGRMTKEELDDRGWHQYQGIKPSQGELNFILDNDSDIAELQSKLDHLKNVIGYLESILQQIKNRDWAIKNHIEMTKFLAGA